MDPGVGAALLAAAVTGLAQGRPGATAIEDLWPAGTLLARGDRGPTW